VVFHIQHHWVTNSGDNILFDPAIATTQPISQTLFAVITYKATINGGTGKFAGATGELNIIGEADTVNGTAFRYSGEACLALDIPGTALGAPGIHSFRQTCRAEPYITYRARAA
jgi:hypothetical protein